MTRHFRNLQFGFYLKPAHLAHPAEEHWDRGWSVPSATCDVGPGSLPTGQLEKCNSSSSPFAGTPQYSLHSFSE